MLQIDSQPGLFIYHIVAVVFLICFILVIIPYRFKKYIERMKILNLYQDDMKMADVLNFAANNTIFEYLILLTQENTGFAKQSINEDNIEGTMHSKQSIDLGQTAEQIKNLLRQGSQQKNSKEYYYQGNNAERKFKGIIIFDFYYCCCEGCPWELKRDNFIFASTRKIRDLFMGWFYKNQKCLSLFVVYIGGYTFIPLFSLTYYTKCLYVIIPLSLIFISLEFFLLTFTLSLITTRREFVRLEKHNQIQRALIIYYHLSKAIVFSVIFACLFCITTLLVINMEGQDKHFKEDPFEVLQFYYYILMNFNLLLLLRYLGCLRSDLISDDDRILKAQQRLYALQNNLIKYVPSDEQIFNSQLPKLNEYIEFQGKELMLMIQIEKEIKKNIIEDLEINLQKAKDKLAVQMRAVENQKFKKIKKNPGNQRYCITTLTLYLYFQCIALLILSILMVLSKTMENYGILNKFYYFFMKIQDFFQYTLVPYFITELCNKKALLGQDYGEKFQFNNEVENLNSSNNIV